MSKRKLIVSNSYNGFSVNVNDQTGQWLDQKIMDGILGEFGSMLVNHSKVFLLRFDLRFSSEWRSEPKLENDSVSMLMEALRFKCRKYGKIATGWVREIEKAKNCHYHCFVLIDGSKVRAPGRLYQDGEYQPKYIIGFISEQWIELTGGNVGKFDFTMVHRSNFEEINGAVYWLSYLAKVRSKEWEDTAVRLFAFSKTKAIRKPNTPEYLLAVLPDDSSKLRRRRGRPSKYSSQTLVAINALRETGATYREIASLLSMPLTTVFSLDVNRVPQSPLG